VEFHYPHHGRYSSAQYGYVSLMSLIFQIEKLLTQQFIKAKNDQLEKRHPILFHQQRHLNKSRRWK